MIKTASTTKLILGLAITALLASCGGDSSEGGSHSNPQDSAAQSEMTKKAKKVFYAIPSPVEMANMIKQSGANYNKDLLNPKENVSKYTTNTSMALNLGIYGADLSYTSIFDQTQPSMQYMGCSKKLADALGITGAFTPETVDRLEKNVNNKDSLLQIVSDAYLTTDAYLKENERASTSALIIAGGWIEGLYIATKIASKDAKNGEISTRIAEQKSVLENLISLIESYPNDPSLADVLNQLKSLNEVYNGIGGEPTKTEASTDNTTKTTTIGNNSTTSLTPEQLATISAKVDAIRTSIIK
ncbi:MAG TPA: hypothetical protein PLI68_09000 [Bacteroidia bacterium]|nr:hypothetical protein [Bacteroidia bacterium]